MAQKKKEGLFRKSLAVGVVRTFLGFPIEHPVDAIKTQWQAHQRAAHELAMVRVILAEKGF